MFGGIKDMTRFPEPGPRYDTAPALLDYLDYFRGAVSRKVLQLTLDGS